MAVLLWKNKLNIMNSLWQATVLILLLLSFVISVDGIGIELKAQDLTSTSLFADRRAHRIGDILTILIVEYSSASSNATTSSQKQSDHGVNATGGQRSQSYMPLYGLKGQLKNGYDNQAGTTRRGSLKGKITAQITDITEGGNLMISGSREMSVNGEKEMTVLSGVVRPEDISGYNTVYSYNVSDLKVIYKGAGDVHKGQRPGLLDKIFNFIF